MAPDDTAASGQKDLAGRPAEDVWILEPLADTATASVKPSIEQVDITVMKCRACGRPMAQSDSHVMGKPANLDPYYVHAGCMYGEPQMTPAPDPRPKRLLPRI